MEEVLDLATRPVVVSHAVVRATCDVNRNLISRHPVIQLGAGVDQPPSPSRGGRSLFSQHSRFRQIRRKNQEKRVEKSSLPPFCELDQLAPFTIVV